MRSADGFEEKIATMEMMTLESRQGSEQHFEERFYVCFTDGFRFKDVYVVGEKLNLVTLDGDGQRRRARATGNGNGRFGAKGKDARQ